MKNIYHEGKLINKAGVDRVVLSHVELKKINWPVFKKAITASSDIIYDAFRSANRTYYVTEGGDRLHYMTITDPEVGHLNFGANPKKYGIIEFSPANKNNGINIVNFDGKELMEYLAHIKVILSDRYGLEVSFTNCTLKEVELNVTFALNHPYDDYYRALSVLFSDMPYLKKQCEYTGKENKEKQLQSCSAFNKQLSVTAYNKSVEMAIALKRKEEIHITDENGVLIESDLMRVEFKLKTAEVCKKWFDGLNTFGDLKEEMSNIHLHTSYWRDIPHLLHYCPLACISDGVKTRLGTVRTPYEHFYAWRRVNDGDEVSTLPFAETETMIKGVYSPARFLELFRDYIYFQDTIYDHEEVEIVCRYPQFFASKLLKQSIVKSIVEGTGKGGTYFGATGCGKTYTMAFLARQLALRCTDIPEIGSPTIILIAK